MPAPRLRILLGSAIAIGPGKADLLEAIDRCGSISAAARAMDMSYRRAWLLTDTMNRCFRDDLVAAAPGGRRGGGAALTPLGREVLDRYRQMEAKAAASLADEMASFQGLLRPEDLTRDSD
ncbi:LysR family transcriptional regulator [Rhodospirillaceae bacterium SYSU D60014]|uniref:winged helix-turn-helix domain-containing protein n=1 Tax=Virgifigura deserti TaxID=2268457 RepID=UPI000E662C86